MLSPFLHNPPREAGQQMHALPLPLWIFLLLLSHAQLSWQQRDPVDDFCRRWGHQSAVVGDKLILDGGWVNWSPLGTNFSNEWLSYHHLTDASMDGMPQLYANLSKNATIPRVAGGVLWADDINGWTYLYGGEITGGVPWPPAIYAYDVWYDEWQAIDIPRSTGISGVSYGAGVSIPERGEGYYYGGWMSNLTVPQWSSSPRASSGLIRYNMDRNEWANITGPDDLGRAEGVMVYLPAGDGGLLVYFGGVVDPTGNSEPNVMFEPNKNGTAAPQPLDEIFIFDVVSTKWYRQDATGDIPESRRRFCGGATWAEDQSSYNIYFFGGLGFGEQEAGFGDVYVLTIPSFTWIKLWPDEGTGPFPHHSLSCNVVNKAQMLIIGGHFPLFDGCDEPKGAHGLDMGKQNTKSGAPAYWDTFKPEVTEYVVPDDIISVVGGSGGGGATVLAPTDGFQEADLDVLMGLKANMVQRTPTRPTPPTITTKTPSPTSSSNSPSQPDSSSLSNGAIAGIAVGSVVAGVLILGLFCFFWRAHRRRMSKVRDSRTSNTLWSPATAYDSTPQTMMTQHQRQSNAPYVSWGASTISPASPSPGQTAFATYPAELSARTPANAAQSAVPYQYPHEAESVNKEGPAGEGNTGTMSSHSMSPHMLNYQVTHTPPT